MSHTIIDVHVLLVRDGEVLLTQRRGGYGGGMWHLPSGKLDVDESLLAAAAREVEEEVGVFVAPSELRCVHTLHVAGSGGSVRRSTASWTSVLPCRDGVPFAVLGWADQNA